VSTIIDRLIVRLFNQAPVDCSDRFHLGFVGATCPARQLFATAEIMGGEEISGATIYVIEAAEAENENARFYAGVLGSAFNNDTTRFKPPLTLGISLFPWEPKEDMPLIVIVGISTPGTDDMCILHKEITVAKQRR
jgi:hypothetical protein